ncbi:MAG: hypothetical protein QXG17_07290 [Sulfolobales archaeon]
MSTSKSEDSNVMSIVSKLIRVLQDSVKVEVIMTLVNEDMASFRLLSRRLRVNHKKLKSNLKPLLSCGIIEEVQIKVADGRVYRAYRLRDEAKRVLQKLLEEPAP